MRKHLRSRMEGQSGVALGERHRLRQTSAPDAVGYQDAGQVRPSSGRGEHARLPSSVRHRRRADLKGLWSRMATTPESNKVVADLVERPVGLFDSPQTRYAVAMAPRSRRFPAAVLALLYLAIPAAVRGGVAVPSTIGPITGPGSPSLDSTTFDLAPFGYAEDEFFVTGTATAYVSDVEFSVDGKWSASPAGTAEYTTRLLVRRPTARRRFNGTVVVEWLNVSQGFDAAPDWTSTHTLLMREGFAWVGVSAQYIGVSGGPPLDRHLALKEVNPVRYGALLHPG